jgi:hypothetical protein
MLTNLAIAFMINFSNPESEKTFEMGRQSAGDFSAFRRGANLISFPGNTQFKDSW